MHVSLPAAEDVLYFQNIYEANNKTFPTTCLSTSIIIGATVAGKILVCVISDWKHFV